MYLYPFWYAPYDRLLVRDVHCYRLEVAVVKRGTNGDHLVGNFHRSASFRGHLKAISTKHAQVR